MDDKQAELECTLKEEHFFALRIKQHQEAIAKLELKCEKLRYKRNRLRREIAQL